MARFDTLEDAAFIYGISPEELLNELSNEIAQFPLNTENLYSRGDMI